MGRTVFIYPIVLTKNFSRSVSPKYGFTIMNRLSIGTFDDHLIFVFWKNVFSLYETYFFDIELRKKT